MCFTFFNIFEKNSIGEMIVSLIESSFYSVWIRILQPQEDISDDTTPTMDTLFSTHLAAIDELLLVDFIRQ